jgi:hypothetical protein
MIALFAMLGAAAGAMPTQAKADLRCAVALSYVRDVVEQARGRRLVFSTSERPSIDLINGEWFEADAALGHPKSLPAPASDLVEGLSRTSTNAVRRCWSVRQFLKTNGIAYGGKAAKAARTRGVFKAYIQTVSLPVVSEDQRRAVLERGEMRGFTDGGGWLELLERKPNGEWKVIGYRPTWMS